MQPQPNIAFCFTVSGKYIESQALHGHNSKSFVMVLLIASIWKA